MELPDFQRTIAKFVEINDIEAPIEVRLLDLVSEVGELAKESLKGTNYGKRHFQPTEQWATELADSFFSLICLANSTNVNLELALEEVLDKYNKRIIKKGDLGSGN